MLDETDIKVLKKYGAGPYSDQLKQTEIDIKECLQRVNDLCGVKETDDGLAPPALWDLAADKEAMEKERPLMVSYSLFLRF